MSITLGEHRRFVEEIVEIFEEYVDPYVLARALDPDEGEREMPEGEEPIIVIDTDEDEGDE